ncbi:beta-propeller domain-containing protein [Candidatus Poriferisodalis sp.]|uniref:beta-propeller domain-containing protein n=1 Tax=Candidatus Poriferisodalis sp. TaxID=3101277 RepID=UPI003B0116B8
MLGALAALILLAAACTSDDSASRDVAAATTGADADDGEPTEVPGEQDGSTRSSFDLEADNDDLVGAASAGAANADVAGGSGSALSGVAEAASLQRFDECAAVLGYVHEHAARAVGPWGLGDGALGSGMDMAESADEAAAGDLAAQRSGVDYSTSNVQEAGIDEPAAIKTDGRRVVVASGSQVHVVDVTGTSPVLVGSVDLQQQHVERLLLHGDRVLAFGETWDRIDADDAPQRDWGSVLRIVEIDLSGAVPRVARHLEIEGNVVGARMVDGVVRIVTSSQPRAMIPWAVPESGRSEGRERATAKNRELISETGVDHWLPRFALRDAAGAVVAADRLVACDRVWAPPDYAGVGTLSVTTLDIAARGLAGPIDTTSIMADGTTVYASPRSLYVSTTRWLDPDEQPTGAADAGASVDTEVHMFDTTQPASTTYVGSASVPGTVLNQYSMSEHEGHLRVATTTAPPWQPGGTPDSESLVTVLAASADGLEQVGQVGGLGLGERIYAVRYLGDVAAVVTFRQVDPLYLLDLSDPSAPEVRGELKITGYSAYLHPLDGDLLLGVGQEATGDGEAIGALVSLFDISDLDQPARIDHWIAERGYSLVESDPLAFLYWQPSSVAVLPLVQEPFDDADAPHFLGAVVLSTDDRRLTERARFSHAEAARRSCNESRVVTVLPDGGEEAGPWERYCWFEADWPAQVIASAVAGGNLYLASHKALEAVSLESLERTALIEWPAVQE